MGSFWHLTTLQGYGMEQDRIEASKWFHSLMLEAFFNNSYYACSILFKIHILPSRKYVKSNFNGSNTFGTENFFYTGVVRANVG